VSYKYNPLSGEFDFFSPPTNEAKRLTDSKIADSNMSALTMVVATSDTNIDKATNDLLFPNANVLGIILSSVTIGNPVEVLFFGKLDDAFFTFPVNDSLFLGINGTITNIPPVAPAATFSTDIGYSLGTGSIFLKIEKPIGL